MSKILLNVMLLVNGALAASLDYTQLHMRDLDQMRALIAPYIKSATSKAQDDDSAGATEAYREALKIILSRPNNDNLVSQLSPEVRSGLRDLNALEDTVQSLADEGVYGITKSKQDVRRKATNVFLLQNIVSEFKPDLKTNPNFKKIYEKIRDAQIEIPKDVKKELALRVMIQNPISPSKLAEEVIGKKP